MDALLVGNIVFVLGAVLLLGRWVYSIDRRLARLENQLAILVQFTEENDG